MKFLSTIAFVSIVLGSVYFMSKRTSPVAPLLTASTPLDILDLLPLPASPQRLAAVEKVKAMPQQGPPWVALGDALAQEFRENEDVGLYAPAEAVYRQAYQIQPKNVEAMNGLAWVCGGRHEFPESIRWAELALEQDSKSAAALGILGDAALELGNYDKAGDRYQAMMDARPDLSSWSRGAHFLWVTGDKGKALWLMGKAVQSGGPHAENTAWCRAKHAMMLFHDGALLPAEQTIAPALASSPQNRHVLLAAAKIAAALAKYEEAARHYQTILKDKPQHDALVGLGDLAAVQGRLEEAETFYKQVESLHATHQDGDNHTHLGMAKFLADHDRNLVEAVRLIQPVKLTANVQAADIVAWVLLKNKDIPNAIATMKRALKQNTPDAEMKYHAGMIAAAAGDNATARKRLNEALSMNASFDLIQAPLAHQATDSLASK